MILNKQNYLLQNNKFKKITNILYDDIVSLGSVDYKVTEFNKVDKPIIKVETEFKDIYLRYNQSLYFKDLLTGSFEKRLAKDLCVMDEICFPESTVRQTLNKINIHHLLFMDEFNYSTVFADIINKYKLPKEFLLKALTTGCPDEEFSKGKEYNLKFQKILDDFGLQSGEDFSKYLLTKYTNEVKQIRVNKEYLDLLYVCINSDYSLHSHTSLELYIYSNEIFSNVISFLTKYNINMTVTNSIYNKRNCSIISINSSLIYNLFLSEFDNYQTIITLTQSSIKYLSKLLDKNIYYFKSELSGYYLQEFFYINKKLFKLNDDLTLTQSFKFKFNKDFGFTIPVTNIEPVNINNNLIDIQLIKHDY